MRILHVSTFDTAGGAALAAYRLHRAMVAKGHESRMLVARRDSQDPTVLVRTRSGDLLSRLRQRVRRWRIRRDFERYRVTRPDWPERFSDDRAWQDWGDEVRLDSYDVVNLHWIGGLLDHESFFRSIPQKTPVVWTLHDMNVFTGGCHYDAGCGKYMQSCGACPQLGSTRESDLSRDIWARKQQLFSRVDTQRLRFVTPSRWLAAEIRNSSVLGDRFPVSVIPYGVDAHEFAPRDRSAARDVLGIPRDARVILFLAYSLDAERKGFRILTEALERLSSADGNVFVLSVGAGGAPDRLGGPNLHLGKITQFRLLSMVYSAADLFVIPSLQDNLPSTVLEAMACGTPVVGFDVGGVPDMVRPGVSGALAPVGDANGLAATISGLLADDAERRRMSEECRRLAVTEYAMELYVNRYVTLYREEMGA